MGNEGDTDRKIQRASTFQLVRWAEVEGMQAFYYSDEILAMKQGHMLAKGSPDEIIREDLLQEVYGIPLPIHRLDGKKFVSTV